MKQSRVTLIKMDTRSNKNDYKYELLNEQVSDVDLFPDQTHARVSESIYRLIDGSDKAITIGVEGSWGSGKSTVIELLKGKIYNDKQKKTLFFLFDAWAHEGDPLRRIFLESLIKEIDPDGKDSYLSKLLLEISGRSKSVKVTTSREASSLGKKLFVSAFMVPIGSALLSINKFKDLTWSIKDIGFSEFIFAIGIILVPAPILFLAWWWMCGEKDEKTEKVRWDFMESDSIENYTQDITEDGERTSIEFEKYFKNIFEYIFDQKIDNKYERAIVVIDNLDRIDTEHAATIWSTLQTFFQHRNCSNKNDRWVKDLWFLVTYDREGLSRIWDSKFQDDNEAHRYNSLSVDGKQKKKVTTDISKSFLGKNFQVIAEVPTPVMSAWQEYCVKCVNKALSEWPENERLEVISTFQRYGSRLDISPTPREIQNFVNQIGLLGMSWGGHVSAEALALYALLRLSRTENELRGDLLRAGLPDDYSTDTDTYYLKQELSGLMFGVPKDKGIQLLLGPVIQDAMRDGDGEALNKVLSEQGEAFWIAWSAIRDSITISGSHTQEYIISATIAMHDGLSPVKNRIKPEIENLEKAWRATSEKWEYKYDYSRAIPMMANLVVDKEEFVSWCFTDINSKLAKIVKQVKEIKADDINALKQISSLSIFLSENGQSLKRLKYRSLDQDGWTQWLELVEEEGIELPTVLPADGAIKSFSANILANPTTTSSSILKVLLKTLELHSRTDEWDSVADAMVTWANNPSRELGDQLSYDLMLGMYSQCVDSASEKIQKCIKNAAFWVKGNAEDINKVKILPVLAARAIGSNIHSDKNVSPAVKDYWKSESNDSSDFEELEKRHQESLVWVMARNEANKKAISIIRNNVGNDKLFSYPKIFIYLNDYRWIKASDQQIVYMICENNNLDTVKKKLESDPLLNAYSLYLLLNYGNQQAIDFVKSILGSLSSDRWLDAFTGNSDLLNCVLDEAVSLDHKYSDAFKIYFNGVLEGGADDDWVWNNFDSLLAKTIDTDILKTDLAIKYFSTSNDNLSDDVFISISGYFDVAINEIDPYDVMVRVCKWLDNNNWDRLLWLTKTGYAVSAKPLESLESRIKEKSKEIGKKDKSILQDISKLFGIEMDFKD